MGNAKDIVVKVISAKDANEIVKRYHYSGKVVVNSQLHFGVFLDGKCGGALQYGPSLDKRRMLGLVAGSKWSDFMELNRMAFADWLPRNSESRAIAYTLRFIKKTYPHVKWIVSFSDATQCGDGTIYRASGFNLIGIKKNSTIWEIDGQTFTDIGYRTSAGVRQRVNNIAKGKIVINSTTFSKGKHILENNGASSMKKIKEAGGKPLTGFQIKYIYFLDPSYKARLTVPILPFSEIDNQGAKMYKGERPTRGDSVTVNTTGFHPENGGSSPTSPLQSYPDEKADPKE